MRNALLLGAALAAIPITAIAQEAAPAGITPEQIVKARRASMMMSGGNLAAMKSAAEGNGDLALLVPGARSLAGWAAVLPSMFPEGTNVPPSNAKAEIWSDRPGFEAAARAYGEAAQRLAQTAQSGDRAAFLAAWTEVRGSCGACHDAYKN